MAHPYSEHRAHKVEQRRVGQITKGYKSGGAVHGDEKEDRKQIAAAVHKHERDMHKAPPPPLTKLNTGGGVKYRADRPQRAKGGGVGKKHSPKGTHVNVIVAPQNHPMGPMAAQAGPPPAVPAMAPRPMGPPSPVAGLGGPPGAPMPRGHGGRTYKKGGRVKGLKTGGPIYSRDFPMGPKLGGGAGGGEARLEKPNKIIIKGKKSK